ncbi:hypothetical protein MAR_030508, partial [Mya arenaria]
MFFSQKVEFHFIAIPVSNNSVIFQTITMVMTQLQSKLVLFGFFVILYLTFTLEAAKDKDSERNFEDLNDRIS